MTFSEDELKWLRATPRQQHADAGWIAWRAGVGTGNTFALFAKRNGALFQRSVKNGQSGSFTYRLSPDGCAVIDDRGDAGPETGGRRK